MNRVQDTHVANKKVYSKQIDVGSIVRITSNDFLGLVGEVYEITEGMAGVRLGSDLQILSISLDNLQRI